MQKVIIFFLLILVSTSSYSMMQQNDTISYRNHVHAEFGGDVLFSLNYERSILLAEFILLSPRVGISKVGSNFGGLITFPIGLNILFGKKNYAELGGITLGVDDSNHNFIYHFHSRIGYRYQPQSKHFFS